MRPERGTESATIRAVNRPTPVAPLPRTHYENFPVASWLCPPRLRPAIAAIYWFARTADDLADEGDAPAQQRLDDLAAYGADLAAVAGGGVPSSRWPEVFGPLCAALRDFELPVPLLANLLSAFEQDVTRTRDRAGYEDRDELLNYCRRSANPVGRLLLHLYGVNDAQALARSDCICTALQLINFWQDLGLDIGRGRFYLPRQDCAVHGVTQDDLLALRSTAKTTKLIASQVEWARATMLNGSALVHQVPGRAGWELRLVVQGGLRILDRIEAMGFNTLSARPRLTAWDAPLLLWRAIWM